MVGRMCGQVGFKQRMKERGSYAWRVYERLSELTV